MSNDPIATATPATARLRLARVDAIDVGALDWLTAEERQRFDGMASTERRDSFLAGHRLARELGAQRHGVGFERVSVHRLDDGRPSLHVDGMASPLSISLSHSGGWILAGIADAPIGVDVEVPRRPRDIEALARHAFSLPEVQRLRAQPEALRLGTFHEIWALKEARGKRSGEGFLPGRARCYCAHPAAGTHVQAVSWRLGEGGAVAIALEGGAAVQLDDGGLLSAPTLWRYEDALPASEKPPPTGA